MPNIQTNIDCLGSCPENPHKLIMDNEKSENKICNNDRCYFILIDKKGVGHWQQGFDYLTAKSFVKPMEDKKGTE